MGPLLDADEDDVFILGEHRDELASLLPLLGLERFDRRVCNHPDDDAEGSPVVRKVLALDRDTLTPDTLGLQLAEAKELLVAVQDTLVEHHVQRAVAAQVACPHCRRPRRHKDTCTIVVRSLFGTLRLPSPRWWHCPCHVYSDEKDVLAKRCMFPFASDRPRRITVSVGVVCPTYSRRHGSRIEEKGDSDGRSYR